MLLVITAAVDPGENAGVVQVDGVASRRQQYYDGLEQCIRTKAFQKIVFCDNTGANLDDLRPLENLAKDYGVQIEILGFKVSEREIETFGKGYGEGKIMEYVLANSQLAKQSTYLVKLTGRLLVDNMKQLSSSFQRNRCYFNIPNRTRRDMVDTRFYAMPVMMFQTYFGQAYQQVKDGQGYFLEHAYADVIKKNSVFAYNMPYYPRIRGLSGSTGATYTYKEWKCKGKDLFSLFQWYRVK